jgi:crotonobetainyl-CoA:carnitine CoA-transferase CaiB-like acyl-CoA transferase
MSRHNGDKPLSGVRVVEVGQFTAGPYGVRLLGLLGAEVIKVEPIGGEPMRQVPIPLVGESGNSYVFHLVNADKKGVTLDLSTPEGKELFLEIIEQANVFAVNLSADFTARVGIDYASLKKVNPGLVYCSVTGFGSEGTWRRRRALDTVLQALGGVMDLTGFPENPPLKSGVSLVDLAGGLFASVAVLAALQHQADTGEGQLVDVAMSDVAAWFSAEVWPLPLAGQDVSRVGNRHWFHAPYNLYQAQDRPVAVGVEKDRQWQSLLQVMDRQDLLGDPRYATSEDRVRRVDEVDRLVEEWAVSLKAADAVSRCQAAGVPAAPVQEIGEVVEHPNTRDRETIIERSGYRIFGSPIKFSRTPLTVEDLGPALGQHNDEVLGGLLGLSRDQRENLKAEGVI